MAETGGQNRRSNRAVWRPVAVTVLAGIGAISAVGFLLSMYVENASFGGPGDEPRPWILVGYAAGLVTSLALPVAAAVVLLRSRWWWVLIAGLVGGALAALTAGVS